MNTFFEKINYSACNEDSFSEIKALDINENEVVLCITASGARSLDLLVQNPKRIVSIDFNKTQNFLLSLKIAAYQSLSYDEFLSFLWIENNFSRKELYKKVYNFLDTDVKNFWDKNMTIIESGVIYAGTWEKILKNLSKLAFFRKKKIQKLFECKNIEEQKDFWEKEWNNATWKIFIKIITNSFLWKKIIKEPGFLLISDGFSVEKYINKKMNFWISNFLLSENHFANLAFLWKYTKREFLPIHLQEKYFEIIKNNVSKIEIQNISLQDVVSHENFFKNFTACSLSDFGSYCTDEEYKNIWKNIVKNGQKQLKICERQFMIKRNTAEISEKIICNYELQKTLEKEDETIFYSFIVAYILK